MTDAPGWGIGGYSPVGYKITPWSDLFPALARGGVATTLSSMYLAKMYTYYLTRLQFGQYLEFLQDVGRQVKEVTRNDAIDGDVLTYRNQCDALKTDIETVAKPTATTKIGEEQYKAVVAGFESPLLKSPSFYSQNVYSAFFANYTFFTECAYGCIFVEFPGRGPDDHSQFTKAWYLTGNPSVPWDDFGPRESPIPKDPFTILPMLADAVRLYPVVDRTGALHLVAFNTPRNQTGWVVPDAWPRCPDGTLWQQRIQVEGTSRFVEYPPVQRPSSLPGTKFWRRLYMVGFDAVPDKYQGKIRGAAPMFNNMPFDFLSAYAAPTGVVTGAGAGGTGTQFLA